MSELRRGRPPIYTFRTGEDRGAWRVVDPRRDAKNRISVRCNLCKRVVRRVDARDVALGRSKGCPSCTRRLRARNRARLVLERGEKRENWRVLKRTTGGRAWVPVQCECGHTARRRLVELLEGRTKRCNRCKGVGLAHKVLVVEGRAISMRRILQLPGRLRVHVSHLEVLEGELDLKEAIRQLVEGDDPVEERRRRAVRAGRGEATGLEARQRALRD